MADVHEMRVKKRNGLLEDVSFDKILNRVKKLGSEAKVTINFSALVMKIIDQLYDEIPTSRIDELTAEQCAYMTTQHLDYGILAARIVISNSQKNIIIKFGSRATDLQHCQVVDLPGASRPRVLASFKHTESSGSKATTFPRRPPCLRGH